LTISVATYARMRKLRAAGEKAARYGIQSITLVAIAGEVLEHGTANASWDVSRLLPKGDPYIGNFQRQKLSKVRSIVSLHHLGVISCLKRNFWPAE